MAKSTKAVAAFHVNAAMERRLAAMKVQAKLASVRPAHWRTEAEHMAAERLPVLARNRYNPFVR